MEILLGITVGYLIGALVNIDYAIKRANRQGDYLAHHAYNCSDGSRPLEDRLYALNRAVYRYNQYRGK